MDNISPSQLPATISVLPGYGHMFSNKRLGIIIPCQILLCITSSLCLSYFIYKKVFGVGKFSWREILEVAVPINKRLKNLEKERAIWQCYIEWIEDYCSVYHGLLDHLNMAATDLDMLCSNNNMFNWKHLSESSGLLAQSDAESMKESDGQYDRDLGSDLELEKMNIAENASLLSSFAKVLADMKISDRSINEKLKEMDSLSGMSLATT